MPSLQAQTRRLLDDRAHRRLLEQQDPDHMDIAGLTSHRRLTASHRSHFRHHARERMMQAGEPGAEQVALLLLHLLTTSAVSYHKYMAARYDQRQGCLLIARHTPKSPLAQSALTSLTRSMEACQPHSSIACSPDGCSQLQHYSTHAQRVTTLCCADAPGLATTTTSPDAAAGVYTPPTADAGAPGISETTTAGSWLILAGISCTLAKHWAQAC